jgi:hypothetical protein
MPPIRVTEVVAPANVTKLGAGNSTAGTGPSYLFDLGNNYAG